MIKIHQEPTHRFTFLAFTITLLALAQSTSLADTANKTGPASSTSASANNGKAKTQAQMKPYAQAYDKKAPKIEMLPIKGGVFLMGSPEDEEDRNEDAEGPQVKIQVEPFWMGKYEITWNQYQAFMDEHDSAKDIKMARKWKEQFDAITLPTPIWLQDTAAILNGMTTDNMPVGHVSQTMAKQFTKWLSIKTGRYYRLPTEAEWEYACRAGSTKAYWWGNDPEKLGDGEIINDVCNFNSKYTDGREGHTQYQGQSWHKVGTGKPNPWGLYNIHGNLAEWCIDGYDEEHYAKLAKLKQPVLWRDAIRWPDELYNRVARGGHWRAKPENCRSAFRVGSQEKWQD